MKESKALLIILVVIAVGFVSLVVLGNKSNPAPRPNPGAGNLVRDNSHKRGSGPVTLVEFGDYQCPACRQAVPILKRIESEYRGKVTFVFRNFPLPGHANASAAHEAAEAAAAQGKFWEMHDLLYNKQQEWSDLSNPIDRFVEYARQLGLDISKFKSDVMSNANAQIIKQDQADGNSLGVQGTPTLFVDGKKLPDYSYQTIKSAVDAALGR